MLYKIYVTDHDFIYWEDVACGVKPSVGVWGQPPRDFRCSAASKRLEITSYHQSNVRAAH